ncbi:MAG: hypothetical protein V1824_04405 [archaeon]
MPSKPNLFYDAENAFSAIVDVGKSLIKGSITTLLILIGSNFLDICFGFSWRETFFIYGIIATFISYYTEFRGYTKSHIFYIVGWISGTYLFLHFGFMEINDAIQYSIIPLAVFVLKLIFPALKKVEED